MSTKVTQAELEETSRVAILELLLNPEHSTSWLATLIPETVEASEEDVEELDALVTARLSAMASGIVQELKNPDTIAYWTPIVKKATQK